MAEGKFSSPRESRTWEITREIKREGSPYVETRITYRIWQAGDGDWKIHVIYSNPDTTSEAILLPKELLDIIIRETVRDDLKS